MTAGPLYRKCRLMAYQREAVPFSSSLYLSPESIHLWITISSGSCQQGWRWLLRPIRFRLQHTNLSADEQGIMKRKCTELLIDEHKIILRIVDTLIAIA